MTAPKMTLVIGATGKTGRRVASGLATRGVTVRPGSRSSEIPFDWERPETWAAALDGVDSAYVTYSPDLAVPAAPPAIEKFAKMAHERGIERLVLLSGRNEEEAQRCERIVQGVNPKWSVVRASWFAQNFSEAHFLEPLQAGVLQLPARDVPEPFVDADDIAAVAVAALTEPGHEGQVYEVTGPRALTFREAVAEIAAATGRDLRYEQVPADAFFEGMRAHGTPEDIIALTQFLFDTVLDGRNSETTDGVQRALGRAPRDFAEYARATAATGIWAAPAPASARG